MASGLYDIQTLKHATFDFHLEYLADGGTPIDLASYAASFQVRPNNLSAVKYLDISGSGVTSGNTGGTGGIYLNSGETGGGQTGGIRILVDTVSMGYVPVGTWHYSLELTVGVTTEEILYGRFVVQQKATRG